jgi:hypothetical protein
MVAGALEDTAYQAEDGKAAINVVEVVIPGFVHEHHVVH